jgi:hypothetical protein
MPDPFRKKYPAKPQGHNATKRKGTGPKAGKKTTAKKKARNRGKSDPRPGTIPSRGNSIRKGASETRRLLYGTRTFRDSAEGSRARDPHSAVDYSERVDRLSAPDRPTSDSFSTNDNYQAIHGREERTNSPRRSNDRTIFASIFGGAVVGTLLVMGAVYLTNAHQKKIQMQDRAKAKADYAEMVSSYIEALAPDSNLRTFYPESSDCDVVRCDMSGPARGFVCSRNSRYSELYDKSGEKIKSWSGNLQGAKRQIRKIYCKKH